MNTQDFLTVLDYMEKEKGISRKVMGTVIENALITAAHMLSPSSKSILVGVLDLPLEMVNSITSSILNVDLSIIKESSP